jgi:hypothetical protein
MPKRHRRQLWAAILATLCATALLLACWLLPTLIPTAWRTVGPPITDGTYQPYVVAGDGDIHYLQLSTTLTPLGDGLHTSTRVTIKITDRRYNRTPEGGGVTATRAEALEAMRSEFAVFCSAVGIPSAAVVFDSSVADPSTTLTIAYPERQHAAMLMSLRRSATYTGWALLAVALPFTVLFIARAVRSRREALASCCRSCGYNLSGLDTSICPECGRDAVADRAARVGRAGRTRRAAGWTLLVIGLAAAVTWACSAFTPGKGQAIYSHAASDGIGGFYLTLNAGGVRLHVIDSAPLLRPGNRLVLTFPTVTPVDDSAPIDHEPIDQIDWSLWRYSAMSSLGPYSALWVSLWAPAFILLSLAVHLLWSGYHARRAARQPAATPVRTFTQNARHYVVHWFCITALLCTLSTAFLLRAKPVEWFMDFARDTSGKLYLSNDYANGGAEARCTTTSRSCPVLSTEHSAVKWFPKPPNPGELDAVFNAQRFLRSGPDNSSSSNVFENSPLPLLTTPAGSLTTTSPQPGLYILPLCALLLVHPARAALTPFTRRRATRPNEPRA